MKGQTRPPGVQDSFLEALHSEIVAGTENLSAWIRFLQDSRGLDALFELEAWLRGLRCFFAVEHLPLSESEHKELVDRDFSAEFRIVRTVLQLCESRAAEICTLGQPDRVEFEDRLGPQGSRPDYHMGKLLEQLTPLDSLIRLIESLNDLRVVIDRLQEGSRQDYQLFLSLGRTLERDLRSCRYVDMLLSQRFRLQYDRVDSAALSNVLRAIADENLRRDTALALLYLLRLLKYLRLIDRDLGAGRPVRHHLVLFSLVHNEIATLSEFLRSRFVKRRAAGRNLSSAMELIVSSLSADSRRALRRELVFAARDADAPPIYARIENSHGLLNNCVQNCIIGVVQAFDRGFDGRTLFPSMLEGQQKALKLRQDLWELRQHLKGMLARSDRIELAPVLERLGVFRESSLRHLMYRDWAQFEHLSDALITSSNQLETRTLLRRFVAFIEALVREVSKRSVLQEAAAERLPE